jgi:hypothetical protein
MNKKYDHFQDHLEWEVLNPDEVISNLTFENNIFSLNTDCIIKFLRDNQYNLNATISGIAESPKELEPNIHKIKGSFIESETIIGYSKDGHFKYKFTGVLIGDTKSNFINPGTSSAIRFQAILVVDKIEKSFITTKSNSSSIQEWFLTGRSNINFSGSTTRWVEKSFKRTRDGIDTEDKSRLIQSSGSGRDYLKVNLSDTSFIVSKVPIEYGPDWSFNLSIEYRRSFGRIPGEQERKAISEIVGFVLGNQLIKIGQTTYDSSLSIKSQEYQEPWVEDIISRCKQRGLPPVEIGDFDDWNRSELLLNEIINPYLLLRAKFQLSDAINKYWISKYSYLGTNLPILSSAVDTLAERIIANHPEIKQYYIEYKVFVALIKEDLDSIENKLRGNPHKDIILNKIKSASQRGSNEKLEIMFEIIKLPIGNQERKAIKARNKMAHSSLGEIDENGLKEIFRLTRAFETLFNRILLKVLGYSGQYIDYYTIGHPQRNINEKIPE